ncbi:glutathione peroxidase [Variovorax ginsengisoli]|uniref:Glutathione peroxidase n=1 Tax=Variovorax ginsengisoli TaxID=363844 RepID=A0ABT9S7C5_9BURK|nr:glutathione peroxidase [Variovorax ginsengisoli]MDP9900263.1 glutathione peroxidase [Variovorax ginsengisoli]
MQKMQLIGRTPLFCAMVAAWLIVQSPLSRAQVGATDPQATTRACPSILQHTFARLQDEKPQNLCQYTGRVVLIVNTASFCGFTPQYKGLEALDGKYRSRGLVVLGFPSNDFSQESGSNKEIADFCESTFGVKFPMFAKSSVRGDDASPLFKQLAQVSGTTPKWNFYKYLIGRDGKVVAAWSSLTAPDDKAFVRAIEAQLGQK